MGSQVSIDGEFVGAVGASRRSEDKGIECGKAGLKAIGAEV